jgi:hypothetical protein
MLGGLRIDERRNLRIGELITGERFGEGYWTGAMYKASISSLISIPKL